MLNLDQIIIWSISLNVSSSEIRSLELLLTQDEKARADRYRFDIHRHRFIVARANLRIILGKYLNLAPEEIKFIYNAKGKPTLALDQNLDRNFQFNLSHSEDMAVCAVTLNSLVGIDLEFQKPRDAFPNLANRFFSKEEAQIISTSTDPNIFLKVWTVKEAYLKATGEGLDKLSQVSTIWKEGEIIGLKVNQIPLNWMIYQFSYPQGYIGALVSSIPKSMQWQKTL
ncbi:phosphopantetheinyl transferase [Synechococcus sp. PCC 7502]|uniref:4'-phosphopantetheinyl transferase family protein n=1 Tax=Synechococcus sp. PCC 7502 TaxID=1173263 RepID=UPI00029FB1F2|nr:4'-phosphopantetheinyl transferase superfamily protein [Synechococcus sp. PCC 7502]AFY72802.1 phosphopantetheinyl transferase [Synechococcus sp. PCC 7502]